MKKLITLCLFLIIFIPLGCKKMEQKKEQEQPGDTEFIAKETIYVYANGSLGDGNTQSNIKYTAIPDHLYIGNMAVADNRDVYIAGKKDGCGYFKNGIYKKLDFAFDIPIIAAGGNDLYYITRTEDPKYQYGYWKNDVFIKLEGCNATYAIAASGENVYVGGLRGAEKGFWKNGVFTALPNCYTIYAMYISGDNIFTVGTEAINGSWGFNCYWENTTFYRQPSFVRKMAYLPGTAAVTADNKIHYIGVQQNSSLPSGYFKDGKDYVVPEGVPVELYQMAALGNDIYVAGFLERNSQGSKVCGYWKNGKDFKKFEGTQSIYGLIVKKN